MKFSMVFQGCVKVIIRVFESVVDFEGHKALESVKGILF